LVYGTGKIVMSYVNRYITLQVFVRHVMSAVTAESHAPAATNCRLFTIVSFNQMPA